MADSGVIHSRLHANHAVELGRFPLPVHPGWLVLEIDIAGSEERLVQRRIARYAPPELASETALAEALGRLEQELATAQQYGVQWPEADAFVDLLASQPGPPVDDREILWLLETALSIEEELMRRRGRPDLWRPLPGRSLAAVSVSEGRLFRNRWNPGGTIREPLWVAADPESIPPMLAGDAVLAERSPWSREEARRRNLAWVESTPKQGLWVPFAEAQDDGLNTQYLKGVQMINFRRMAPALEGTTWSGVLRTADGRYELDGLEWKSASRNAPDLPRAEAPWPGEVKVGWATVFHKDEGRHLGLAWLEPVAPVKATGVDPGWENLLTDPPALFSIEGLRLFLPGGEHAVLRDQIRPAESAERPVDVPGLILFEWPSAAK